MRSYYAECDSWMKLKALKYFLNFIRKYNRPVDDDDFFQIIDEVFPDKKWLEPVRKNLSAFPKMQKLVKNDEKPTDFPDSPVELLQKMWNHHDYRHELSKELCHFITSHLASHPLENFAKEVFPQRVDELQKTFQFSDFEMDILLVFAFFSNNLLTVPDGNLRGNHSKATITAQYLDCDVQSVFKALSNSGKLRRYECIDCDWGFNGSLFEFLDGTSDEPLSSRYFKRDKAETLPWEFYGESINKSGEILKSLIRAKRDQTGVNILLYGAPGTGKTSFAHTLAAELGLECFNIAQSPEDDSKKSNSRTAFRFAAIQICDSQVDPSRSLMIVDEADDLLRGNSMAGMFSIFGGPLVSQGDKGLLNSVLDKLKTPTIWISNAPARSLDESSRRRFDYSIKFEPLSNPQRLSIWQNNVKKLKLEALFDESTLEEFSSRYAISAGGITQVLQNVVKLAPQKDNAKDLVHQLVVPHCELMGIPTQTEKFAPAKDYSLEGLNIKGKIQLGRIVEAVRNYLNDSSAGIDRPRMNILLSGPPGTGKTEFVKYLGSQLNRNVSVKMGSDLLDSLVGGTEQNIMRAFAQAEQEHSILFLDEIDGLVQKRERSQFNWEVTQVNELLHQMENFSGIMIGATNFSDRLDQAILRRFTFKLEFDYLTDAGKIFFFENMFQTKLSESERDLLSRVPNLTPGDFRTVRQSLFYLGNTATNSERIDALEQESRLKNQNRSAVELKIGF